MPNEFVVQLYNPDQQIRVEVKSSLFGSDSYEFSMPQDVFRAPSTSSLDKGQSDPASLATTPRISFVWRKESKFNKDLTCFMTGKSTDTKKKSSRKDPDITVGLWKSKGELTIYEPNLSRVDMEDPKGLEVVMLLTAVVIKDLYLSTKDQVRELFSLSDSPARKLSGGGRRISNPKSTYSIVGAPNPLASHPVNQQQLAGARTPNEIKRNSLPKLQTTPPQASSASRPPPMADPRAQWELDAETARLKAQVDAEQRQAAHQRREREKAEDAEHRRLKKMYEEEQKAERRRQAEVEKETERLRKQYGVQPIPQRPNISAGRQQSRPHNNNNNYLQPIPQGGIPPPQPARPSGMGSNGLYVQPSTSSSAVFMSGGNPNGSSLNVPGAGFQKPAKKKSSFFGLRSLSDDGGLAVENQRRLAKKGSAMW